MSELSSSDWSEAAASNTQAPPNGWPESMAPSGVNDAAREMMAVLKRFWNRINPSQSSGGSANAYTITPTSTLAAYVDGETYSFQANFANTGSATLNISGLGAKTIKRYLAGAKSSLIGGEIASGQPVSVVYDGTDMVLQTAPATSGKLIQRVLGTYTTYSNTTSSIPVDDSIPQNTEGTEIITASITPTSTTSRLRIRVHFPLLANGSSALAVAALFQDSTASALQVSSSTISNSNISLTLEWEMAAGTISATTFKVRLGTSTGTLYVNGGASSRLFGGVSAVTMTIDEIVP